MQIFALTFQHIFCTVSEIPKLKQTIRYQLTLRNVRVLYIISKIHDEDEKIFHVMIMTLSCYCVCLYVCVCVIPLWHLLCCTVVIRDPGV